MVYNLNFQYILYAIISLLLLLIILKILKLPLKILLNGLSGFIVLYLVNYFTSPYNFIIPVNPITSLITGFLGIPGILILAGYFYFI